MKDAERDFIKKIGIFILGIVIGVILEKVSNSDLSGVIGTDNNQSHISVEYVEALPTLEEINVVTEQDYGEWIGRNGICLDSCNGRECLNEKMIINLSEPETTIIGWAADFNSVMPLKELYMKVGDKIIKCTYGEERQSVVDHYQDENLRYVGINMTVPTDIFEGKDNQIAFIEVCQDGEHIYKPVEYEVEYVE